MSDETQEMLQEMIDWREEYIEEFSQKLDILRSEVDTIGNVLLQLIHAKNQDIVRGEEE